MFVQLKFKSIAEKEEAKIGNSLEVHGSKTTSTDSPAAIENLSLLIIVIYLSF